MYKHLPLSTILYIWIIIIIMCTIGLESHMEDWEAKCVASLNKDFTYLLTYLLTRLKLSST